MFCGHCGAELEDGIRFCTKCGKPIHTEVKDENAGDKPEEGHLPEEGDTLEEGDTSIKSKNSKNNKNRKNKISTVTIVELIVLCIVCISCVVVYNQTSTAVVITGKYLDAYAQGDYEQMYHHLTFEEKDQLLVSKESFVTAGVTCYQEEERPIQSFGDMKTIKGGLLEAEVQVNCESSSGEYVEVIALEREGLKWKVVESKLQTPLLQPIEILVPTQTMVVVDKMNISELVKPETKFDTDTYHTKALFGGNHLVECTMEERKDTSVIRSLSPREAGEEATMNYITMAFTDEMYKQFENMVVDDFAEILKGIINKQDIRDMQIYSRMYDVLQVYIPQDITYSENEFYNTVTEMIASLESGIEGDMEYTESEVIGFKITDAGYTSIRQCLWEEEGTVVECLAVQLEPYLKERSLVDQNEYITRSIQFGLFVIRANGKWNACIED